VSAASGWDGRTYDNPPSEPRGGESAIASTGVCRVGPSLEQKILAAGVRAILEHPLGYEWTVQGLGMLRMYLSEEYRLHVWDERLRVPNVSQMHTHPWDFDSYVVAGVIEQRRYLRYESGSTFTPDIRFVWQQSIVCGAGGGLDGEPQRAVLREQEKEVYVAGQTYRQVAEELHISEPLDGSITIIERRFHPDTEHAYVYWDQALGKAGWVSAEPREATPREVIRTCEYALARWRF
jgi:hypothetical protein